MLKTRKLISLVLVVALVLSMGIVGMVSASAAEGDYYLMGSMNGWAITDGYAFSENSGNPGEYMLMGVSLSAGDTFKVKQDNGDRNTGWYPDGMGNDGTVDADGTYNIYFNPNGNPDWTANSGYCYLEPAGDQDPTDPPADPTDPPADPTDPPADPTDPPADPTEPPVTGNDAKITIDGVSYNAHVDDTIHYEFLLNMNGVPADTVNGKPGKITEFEGRLFYDKSKLELTTSIEGVENEGTGVTTYEFLPNIKSGNVVIANDDPEFVGYNGVQLNGYNFSSEKVLVHADFKVKAAGESTITNLIKNLGSGEVKVVYLDEVKEQFGSKSTVKVDCPHGDQTDAPTEAKTDAPTTGPVGDKAVVTIEDWNGTTETREFKIGDEFSVISYLQVPEGKRVNSIDIRHTFNIGDAVVELQPQTVTKTDDDGEEYTESVPALTPQIKDVVINTVGNVVKANGSKAKYNGAYKFATEDAVLIQAFYKVVANGETKIKTNIETMATIEANDDMTNQIMGGEKVGTDDIKTRTVFDAKETPTDAPIPTEPPTDAPIPTEPPTENPIKGSTYYLTGSIAGWAAQAEYEFQPDGDGQYKITGIALTTEDMIKGIKTSKNGQAINDWYPDGMDNNITVDHDSTYTVIFRPAGDGTAEAGFIYSWPAGDPDHPVGGGTEHWGYIFKLVDEQAQPTDAPTTAPETDAPTTAPETDAPTTAPETDAPTTAPETDAPTDAPHGLWVVADGKWYAVEKDQVIDYAYYLNDGEKVCSLDAETFYDVDGLQWNKQMTWDEDEGADEYLSKLFPVIKKSMVLNDNVAGRLKYNYSSATGKNFNTDEKELIHMNFTVTADEGIYYINTFVHTVAGADEHKYIFNDETLDELQRSEGLLVGLDPNPEPPTGATEAPTTAPETDAPTTAPETDAPTTAPETDEPTTAAETYDFEQNPYVYYKADGGDLVMVVHNSVDDTKTYGNFDKLEINGNVATNAVFSEGSLIITFAEADIDANFNVGSNEVIAYFSDDTAEYMANTVVEIKEGSAPTEAPSDATEAATSADTAQPATNGGSSTNDQGNVVNNSAVQTGSTEMALIFLVVLVMAAGIVIYTKKRKVD